LSLSELTLGGGADFNEVDVMDGTLAIGTLATSNGFVGLTADSTISGTGVVTVGSLAAGIDVDLFSYGAGALIVDSSPTDSSGTVDYDVDDGGMIKFTSGSPTQEIYFDSPDYVGAIGGGTYAFENPGSVITTPVWTAAQVRTPSSCPALPF